MGRRGGMPILPPAAAPILTDPTYSRSAIR